MIFSDEKDKYKNQKKKAANERAKSSKLRAKVTKLESPKHESKIRKKGIKEFVHSKFKGKAQRKALITGQKRAHCDKMDICESLVIRALGRKSYNHLRKFGPVYYPSIATQDRHLEKIMKCRPGYV